MAGVVSSSNVEEEYLWTCTLTGESKEFSWSPEDPSDTKEDDESDPSVKPGHRLLIKSAILMPSAKKDEVTIVQIEGEGYNKSKVTVPIVAMRGGVDHQTYVDLLVPCPAKLVLLQGEGPIHLVGSHCVDFYGYRDTGAGDDTQEDIEADDEAIDEKETADLIADGKGDAKSSDEKKADEAKDAEKTKTPKKNTPKKDQKDEEMKSPAKEADETTPSKKRKASTEQPNSQEKKAK